MYYLKKSKIEQPETNTYYIIAKKNDRRCLGHSRHCDPPPSVGIGLSLNLSQLSNIKSGVVKLKI